MYKYGKRSLERLETCDDRIQLVMHEVMKLQLVDVSIIEGHRSFERQHELYKQGLSQIDGISKTGNHNYNPSRAVDAAAYPIDWRDAGRFALLAGVVLAVSRANGIGMKWGGDWNLDFSSKDHDFFDGPHFELLE